MREVVGVGKRQLGVYYLTRTSVWGIWNGSRMLCVWHNCRLDRCKECSRAHCKDHRKEMKMCDKCKTPAKGMWQLCGIHRLAITCKSCYKSRAGQKRPASVARLKHICAGHRWTLGCRACKAVFGQCKQHRREMRVCNHCIL